MSHLFFQVKRKLLTEDPQVKYEITNLDENPKSPRTPKHPPVLLNHRFLRHFSFYRYCFSLSNLNSLKTVCYQTWLYFAHVHQITAITFADQTAWRLLKTAKRPPFRRLVPLKPVNVYGVKATEANVVTVSVAMDVLLP